MEKYLGANRNKEMKIKSLLKFFLLLEEDRGSLYHIRSISSLFLYLAPGLFHSMKFHCCGGGERRGMVEGCFSKVVPGVLPARVT